MFGIYSQEVFEKGEGRGGGKSHGLVDDAIDQLYSNSYMYLYR